jgi:uncharacterized protein YfiM (DUF2279 family)
VAAKGPVGTLDVTERFGGIDAVLLIADLPELVGALAEAALIAAGKEKSRDKEWEPSRGQHIPGIFSKKWSQGKESRSTAHGR